MDLAWSRVIFLLISVLLLTELPSIFYNLIPNIPQLIILPPLQISIHKINKLQNILFISLSFYLFSIALEPISQMLCLLVLQNFYHKFKSVSQWLPGLLIILANHIQLNTGPHYQNNFLTFMSWNVNSLAKNDFQRVQLIEAHNSIFNYDIIGICETALNDSTELPEVLLNDYTFISSNNPANTKHGGVGLFYKNSLPIKVRDDLSFPESIVVELKFGRKKIFYTVLYRSPAFKHNSPEFQDFISNFKNFHSKIKSEGPFASFFTGDFNGHSELWWPDGDTTAEGEKMENTFTSLGLSQIINQPTNFVPHKNPTCIDLIFTDQPNLVLDCGTRSSLDSFCHHQIIHCKINNKIPPPPPFERRIWHYDRANHDALKRSIQNFPWVQHCSVNIDPNW